MNLRRLRLRQPVSRARVVELAVAGVVGRWFRARGWGGVTLPLPLVGVTAILYWALTADAPVEACLRVHEHVHAAQAERLGPARFYARYLAEVWRHGYRNAPMEREAREETAAAQRQGWPAWARDVDLGRRT